MTNSTSIRYKRCTFRENHKILQMLRVATMQLEGNDLLSTVDALALATADRREFLLKIQVIYCDEVHDGMTTYAILMLFEFNHPSNCVPQSSCSCCTGGDDAEMKTPNSRTRKMQFCYFRYFSFGKRRSHRKRTIFFIKLFTFLDHVGEMLSAGYL